MTPTKLPLGFERGTYAVSRSLAGFVPNPVGRDYWNAWQLRRVAGAQGR